MSQCLDAKISGMESESDSMRCFQDDFSKLKKANRVAEVVFGDEHGLQGRFQRSVEVLNYRRCGGTSLDCFECLENPYKEIPDLVKNY